MGVFHREWVYRGYQELALYTSKCPQAGAENTSMNVTPDLLLADISHLSEEYFKLSMELAEISERKAFEWLRMKKELQVSNAEVDKNWEAAADGRRESYLKIYLKGLEKLRAARMLEYRANQNIL